RTPVRRAHRPTGPIPGQDLAATGRRAGLERPRGAPGRASPSGRRWLPPRARSANWLLPAGPRLRLIDAAVAAFHRLGHVVIRAYYLLRRVQVVQRHTVDPDAQAVWPQR